MTSARSIVTGNTRRCRRRRNAKLDICPCEAEWRSREPPLTRSDKKMDTLHMIAICNLPWRAVIEAQLRRPEHPYNNIWNIAKNCRNLYCSRALSNRFLGHTNIQKGKASGSLYRVLNTAHFVQREFHCPTKGEGRCHDRLYSAWNYFSRARDPSHLEEIGLKDAPADLVTRAERLR